MSQGKVCYNEPLPFIDWYIYLLEQVLSSISSVGFGATVQVVAAPSASYKRHRRRYEFDAKGKSVSDLVVVPQVTDNEVKSGFVARAAQFQRSFRHAAHESIAV